MRRIRKRLVIIVTIVMSVFFTGSAFAATRAGSIFDGDYVEPRRTKVTIIGYDVEKYYQDDDIAPYFSLGDHTINNGVLEIVDFNVNFTQHGQSVLVEFYVENHEPHAVSITNVNLGLNEGNPYGIVVDFEGLGPGEYVAPGESGTITMFVGWDANLMEQFSGHSFNRSFSFRSTPISFVEYTPDPTPTPGETTPGETTPGETTPGETTPGETTPGETTPGDEGGTETVTPTAETDGGLTEIDDPGVPLAPFDEQTEDDDYVYIDDPGVPLADFTDDGDYMYIDDLDVPLADFLGDDDYVIIDDPAVPLDAMPQTGLTNIARNLTIAAIGLLVSTAVFGVSLIYLRKLKKDKAKQQ